MPISASDFAGVDRDGTPDEIWQSLLALQGESMDGCVAAMEAAVVRKTILGVKAVKPLPNIGASWRMPRMADYIRLLANEAHERFGHDQLDLIARLAERLAWNEFSVFQFIRQSV